MPDHPPTDAAATDGGPVRAAGSDRGGTDHGSDPTLVQRPRRPPAPISRPWAPPILTFAWWLCCVAVAVVHNGLWTTPNVGFFSAIAEHLGENPFPATLPGDYLMTDVSLTTLARITGQIAPYQYARLHVIVLVVVWALVTALVVLRFGHRVARVISVVLAASPLVTVSLQWIGQPDPITGMCGIAMVVVRRWWSVALLALLAGLTHPEQAVFMAVVAVVVRTFLAVEASDHDLVARSTRAKTVLVDLLAAVGGVMVGRAVTEVYFRVSGITIANPRTDFLRLGLDAFVDHHTQHPLGLVWTLWGPLWLVFAGVAVRAVLIRSGVTDRAEPDRGAALFSGRRGWWVVAVLGVAALVPIAVTLDETRVYAVITAPLLPLIAILVAWALPRWAPWAIGLLVITAVMPGGLATGVTSWRSQIHTGETVRFLVDGSLPRSADGDLTAWLLEPFDFVIPTVPAERDG